MAAPSPRHKFAKSGIFFRPNQGKIFSQNREFFLAKVGKKGLHTVVTDPDARRLDTYKRRHTKKPRGTFCLSDTNTYLCKSSDDMMNNNRGMVIQKKSLADMVAEQLRQQVAEGVYKIGDKLPTEPELMKSFKVGRSTIREAVKLLVNMGVVQVRQGAGTFVTEPADKDEVGIRMNIADRTELDEVRKILDVAIVEKAVARRTEKDVERMYAALAARKENARSGALKECIEADLNFHTAIADATHNRILADIYRSASQHLLAEFNRMYDGTDCFIHSQNAHEKLLKHIIAGDLKNARKMVTQIVEEP